jgi:hypothetical protein
MPRRYSNTVHAALGYHIARTSAKKAIRKDVGGGRYIPLQDPRGTARLLLSRKLGCQRFSRPALRKMTDCGEEIEIISLAINRREILAA